MPTETQRLPIPVSPPKNGIDAKLAMANLQCVQGSFEPKHDKQAGVAYLASLWFKEPK